MTTLPAALFYRPFEYDDWGTIRNADGSMFASVRRPLSEEEAAVHRAAKTDPFEDLARRLIASFEPAPHSAVPEAGKVEQQTVWVQNLIGFINGHFPADAQWKSIFIKNLSTLASVPAPSGAEPVAWRRMNKQRTQSTAVTDVKSFADQWAKAGDIVEPLYAAPQAVPAEDVAK